MIDNALRSDDTEARNGFVGCFGRSGRRAPPELPADKLRAPNAAVGFIGWLRGAPEETNTDAP